MCTLFSTCVSLLQTRDFCVRLSFACCSSVGAEAKNQLLVLRSLANIFSKSCGAQFMLDEQEWV